ncbi:DUF4424 domain-containing protein [Aquibacillus koreensis]|uniref:DUF4424 domain-containing protein n=1 Tax=Aquibacillus koreensis TaxID=279446 RepID=A0A9X3WNY7_9BACI|nr:DUF4424 domain-containing protein [Aquibacillus koreensis]MCT2538170.1 DUF4424 domain-containing protein [Aquibacillus koreensis]MDC3420886.1 DUF4424 domain-containing protein [Aquibacillus koreensis]
MKKILFLFIFASAFSTLLAQPAAANGTSFFEDSAYPTGHVLPLEEDRVSIVSEELIIELEEKLPSFFEIANGTMVANIQVTYQMLNQTDEDITIPIAFPQPGETKGWNITLDENEISLSGVRDLYLDDVMGQHKQEKWIHPRTGEAYTFGGQDVISDTNTMEAKTFDVTLKAGETHDLVVAYSTKLGIDESINLHPVYRLDYLLHPASYWSDVEELFIEITAPKFSDVNVNLDLAKIENHIYAGVFDTLPEENLVLFVTPSSGILTDLFDSRVLALLSIIVLVLLYVVIIRKLKRKKLLTLFLLILFVLAGYDLLSHKILGYPFTFVQYVLFVIYVVLLSVIRRRYTPKTKRNAAKQKK